MFERMESWVDRNSRLLRRLFLIVFCLSFAGVFALLIWKCRYGSGTCDETFYLAVPLRFLQGDRLLVDETHLTQFSFFTMVPAMWIYLTIAGTTEGIVLAFRYIYTVIWSAGCLFLYLRARRINHFGAGFASLFLMCYAPFGIMALSYYSLGVLYLVNAAVFLLCAKKHQKLQFTLSGLFFAGAVLTCPYLAVVYFAYSIALGLLRIQKKRLRIVFSNADAVVCWKYFTLGILLLAAPFFFFLLRDTSLETLLSFVNYDLQDPWHSEFSPILKITSYFRAIAQSNAYFYPMLAVLVLMMGFTLWRKRAIWFAVSCAAVVLYLRRFMVEYAFINYLMFPLTMMGIYVLAVTKRKEIRQTGLLWFVPGVIYTFCMNYASAQEFYAISAGAAVSSAASLIMVWMYCGEVKEAYQASIREPRKYLYAIAYLAALVLSVSQLRYEVPVRAQSVYWEMGLMKYMEQRTITEGPQKGVIASAEYAEYYNRLYPEVKDIRGKPVLFLTEEFWMWLLDAKNENASYSAWLVMSGDDVIDRLQEYYRLNPRKIPEMIYLENRYDSLLRFFPEDRYHLERLESGSYLITPLTRGEMRQDAGVWP